MRATRHTVLRSERGDAKPHVYLSRSAIDHTLPAAYICHGLTGNRDQRLYTKGRTIREALARWYRAVRRA